MKKIFNLVAIIIFSSGAIAQQIKISELPTATGLCYGCYLPVVQSGVTKKLTTDNIAQQARIYADQIALLKENKLGNPTINGQILSSTTAGVRSWITLPPPPATPGIDAVLAVGQALTASRSISGNNKFLSINNLSGLNINAQSPGNSALFTLSPTTATMLANNGANTTQIIATGTTATIQKTINGIGADKNIVTSVNGNLADSDGNAVISVGTGTVTSVATGNGLTGGTITTSGTLKADTSILKTVADAYGDSLALASRTLQQVTDAGNTTDNPIVINGEAISYDPNLTSSYLFGGEGNTGNNLTATGIGAAYNNTGENVTAEGRNAAFSNSGNNIVATGIGAAEFNTFNNIIATGYLSTATSDNQSVTKAGNYNFRTNHAILTANRLRNLANADGNEVLTVNSVGADNTGNIILPASSTPTLAQVMTVGHRTTTDQNKPLTIFGPNQQIAWEKDSTAYTYYKPYTFLKALNQDNTGVNEFILPNISFNNNGGFQSKYIPVTVNGYQANPQGNITLPVGVTSLSAIGSTPNANAATITGSILNLQPASATWGGVVTTGTQSFAGDKLYLGELAVGTSLSNSTKIRNISGYNGIWFNQATPSLQNYSFLYDTPNGLTSLSSPLAFNIRIANDYDNCVQFDANKNFSIGYSAAGAAPNNKLSVNGNVFIANTAAPATPTGGGIIYVEGGALKYKGSSGTVTVLGAP